jgi:hypothetical protein
MGSLYFDSDSEGAEHHQKGVGPMRKIVSMMIVLLSSAALVAGCATANTVANARASLDKAKAAGAQTKAPEDYYMAEAYYQKADHETKEGDKSEAKTFAEKSIKYSDQAIQKAGGGAK